jgi:hypothetical protein
MLFLNNKEQSEQSFSKLICVIIVAVCETLRAVALLRLGAPWISRRKCFASLRETFRVLVAARPRLPLPYLATRQFKRPAAIIPRLH